MQNSKVWKNRINSWSTESTIQNIHKGHLPQSHHSPGVKLLRDVKVRRQPKELGKVSVPDVELSAICHQHKDSLFPIKKESGVELCVDLLVLVVAKLQEVRDAMELTSF
jgi:hypothetical protein